MSATVAKRKDAAPPLKEFWAFIADFQNFYAVIAKFAVFAPLLDFVLNIGPSWPARLTVTTLMVLIQIVILALSFAIWRQGKTSHKTLITWLAATGIGFIAIALFLYLPLFIAFVRDDPDARHRVVIGYALQPHLQKFVVKKSNESWSSERLLREFEDGQTGITDIWTPQSVYIARYLLLLVWLIVMLLFGVCISAFVAIQYRRIGKVRAG